MKLASNSSSLDSDASAGARLLCQADLYLSTGSNGGGYCAKKALSLSRLDNILMTVSESTGAYLSHTSKCWGIVCDMWSPLNSLVICGPAHVNPSLAFNEAWVYEE